MRHGIEERPLGVVVERLVRPVRGDGPTALSEAILAGRRLIPHTVLLVVSGLSLLAGQASEATKRETR
jgi:hypothetical protein